MPNTVIPAAEVGPALWASWMAAFNEVFPSHHEAEMKLAKAPMKVPTKKPAPGKKGC